MTNVYKTQKPKIIDPANEYYHKVPARDSILYSENKLETLTSMCGKKWRPKHVNMSTFELAQFALDPCPACWPNQAIAA